MNMQGQCEVINSAVPCPWLFNALVVVEIAVHRLAVEVHDFFEGEAMAIFCRGSASKHIHPHLDCDIETLFQLGSSIGAGVAI